MIKRSKKLNPVAVAISNMEFNGNIIPHSWLDCIDFRHKSGLVDLPAIILLADLIYWYRLKEVRDEASGKLIGFKHKFRADKLQKYYSHWAKNLGLTVRQTREAAYRLREKGYLTIEMRKVVVNGKAYGNVPFFEPVPKKIKSITKIPSTAPTGEGGAPISPERDSPLPLERKNTKITYTKTTPPNKPHKPPVDPMFLDDELGIAFIKQQCNGTLLQDADPRQVLKKVKLWRRTPRQVEFEIDITDSQYRSSNTPIADPTGLLISRLSDGVIIVPDDYVSRTQQIAEQEKRLEEARQKTEEIKLQEALEDEAHSGLERQIDEMSDGERDKLFEQARKITSPTLRNNEKAVRANAVELLKEERKKNENNSL